MSERRVAITGIGCLSPNGNGREAYARALLAGASGVGRISLFDPEGLVATIAGEIKGFDPAAHISAKDLKHVSRAVPLAIAASAEALADAGIDPEGLSLDERRAMGVVLGTGGGAVEFSERMYHLYYTNQVKKASVYAIASGTIGTLSSEISMRFGLRGLSHVVSTGCASSTDAMGYAFRSIKFGTADVVLTGGADATVVRGIMEGFIMMRVVSTAREREPRRASRPFSARPRRLRPRRGLLDVRAGGARARAGARRARSTPRSAATAPRATRTTACAWTRRARSPRGRCRSRWGRPASIPRRSTTSRTTEPPRS